jgi:hypothetical protein
VDVKPTISSQWPAGQHVKTVWDAYLRYDKLLAQGIARKSAIVRAFGFAVPSSTFDNNRRLLKDADIAPLRESFCSYGQRPRGEWTRFRRVIRQRKRLAKAHLDAGGSMASFEFQDSDSELEDVPAPLPTTTTDSAQREASPSPSIAASPAATHQAAVVASKAPTLARTDAADSAHDSDADAANVLDLAASAPVVAAVAATLTPSTPPAAPSNPLVYPYCDCQLDQTFSTRLLEIADCVEQPGGTDIRRNFCRAHSLALQLRPHAEAQRWPLTFDNAHLLQRVQHLRVELQELLEDPETGAFFDATDTPLNTQASPLRGPFTGFGGHCGA